jgi:hypothetical protein
VPGYISKRGGGRIKKGKMQLLSLGIRDNIGMAVFRRYVIVLVW